MLTQLIYEWMSHLIKTINSKIKMSYVNLRMHGKTTVPLIRM